ncbi:MAG: tRNA 2-thiouridine(34) synthase MnmA [Thermodesulfobacteriota bacterium]
MTAFRTKGRDLTGLSRIEPGRTVAVAVSGGVDSALAAWTLKQRGFRVLAFHLLLIPGAGSLPAARSMARRLELDFEALDVSQAFESLVIEPFVRTYALGRTPSPCVTCNPEVKFGLLADLARRRGADFLATGHYAGLVVRAEGATPVLVRPRDRTKDQTYFLSRLGPEKLDRALFPLAGFTKIEVKAKAAALGLPETRESQEACFLAGRDYRDFLSSRLGPSPGEGGEFVDRRGRVLGRHRGLIHYTVGQRRGLNLPGPEPYYVLALEQDTRRVVVGTKAETLATGFLATDLVWSSKPAQDEFAALVQIRSRHKPARAWVSLRAGNQAEVFFESPQPAVAPGQAAAFYEGDWLRGGGWIDRVRPVTSDTRPPEPA